MQRDLPMCAESVGDLIIKIKHLEKTIADELNTTVTTLDHLVGMLIGDRNTWRGEARKRGA